MRRFVDERARYRRCDDHLRIVDAGKPAQAARDVAREPVALLCIQYRLRRQRTGLLENLVGARKVCVRDAGQRQAHQQIVAPIRVDAHVIAPGNKGDVPAREALDDFANLLGTQGHRKEQYAVVAPQR